MRILTGNEIRRLAEQGEIFRANFNSKNCETAFYSLTLGQKVQSVTRREPHFRELREPLILGPGEVMNVEIHERFNFNDSTGQARYAGLIVSRARLLAGGISHPPTAVDPGATRATYLTLINHTSFPGPRMFPGSDKIAKMLIFAYSGEEEIPESWEPTAPYSMVGPEEMPQFWPLSPEPWTPATSFDVSDIAALRERFGAPFDIIALGISHVYEATVVNRTSESALRTTQTEIQQTLTEFRDRLRTLDGRIDKLSEDVAFSKGEVSTWLRTRLEDAERRVDRKEGDKQFRLNLWAAIFISLLSAVVGVLLALWLQ